MNAWLPLLYITAAAVGLILAYLEGKRSRGAQADATEAMMEVLHEVTLEKLGDALDNANATHEAALAIVRERGAIVSAFRSADPGERHRLLLAPQNDSTSTTIASGGTEPGPA